MKRFLWLGLVFAVCAGCGRKAQQAEAARDIDPETQAFYKAHPDFFHFKTIDDLPKDLVWQDGHDVPTFADPEAKRGGTLNLDQPDFPRTLRFYGPDADGAFRTYILDEEAITLTQKQPNVDRYFPGLAREWAYDPDGRTMYFKLDPDARYSDGVPVRADDFVFSFYLLQSKYLADPNAANFVGRFFAQITKYDDLTISVSLKEAKPDIDDRLGGVAPAPEHFYKELGPDYPQRYQWRLEPTTGPYTIKPEDIHKGVSIDLTRVPNWWADNKPFFRHRYNVDRIHFQVIRDPDKMVEVFKRGDIDVVDISRPQAWREKVPDSDPIVQKGAVVKVIFYNQVPREIFGMYLNRADPLLADHDIREGISYALNFDLVSKQYYYGDWTRMQTFSDGYAEVPLPGIHARPFSLDKAAAYFAKAGFTSRGPDGILVNSHGQRLSFTVTCPYERMREPLTILRQEALKAGLELKLEIMEFTAGFKKIDEKHHQIALCIVGSAGVIRYPDYWQFYDSKTANRPTTNNFTNMVDPEMDKLIKAYDNARTMDEVRDLAHQIEVRIHDDAAFIPVLEWNYFRAAYWRWLRFPKDYATKESMAAVGQIGLDFGLFWIDDDMRPKVQAALNGGPKLPVEIKVYDQWKQK